MSRRQKLKKNRRMNEFIRKYWCVWGKHLVPFNRMVSVRAFEDPKVYQVCDLHMKDISDRIEKVG